MIYETGNTEPTRADIALTRKLAEALVEAGYSVSVSTGYGGTGTGEPLVKSFDPVAIAEARARLDANDFEIFDGAENIGSIDVGGIFVIGSPDSLFDPRGKLAPVFESARASLFGF